MPEVEERARINPIPSSAFEELRARCTGRTEEEVRGLKSEVLALLRSSAGQSYLVALKHLRDTNQAHFMNGSTGQLNGMDMNDDRYRGLLKGLEMAALLWEQMQVVLETEISLRGSKDASKS